MVGNPDLCTALSKRRIVVTAPNSYHPPPKQVKTLPMKIYRMKCFLPLLAILLLTSCSGREPQVEKRPVEVKVLTVQRAQVQSEQSYSGSIEELDASTMSFPIAGTVQSVSVSLGQKVQRGTLIATLDARNARNTYDAAAAALEQCSDAHARMEKLHDNNSLPEMQWIEIESKLKQARATYDIAQKNLEDTRLYAPCAGYIAQKEIEVGSNVLPGAPVVKVVTLDQVKVCISVPENEIGGLVQGTPIRIQVAALGGRTFDGQVEEKGVAADALSRSYVVKAVVDNPEHALLPGMLCTLSVARDATPQSVLLLPRHVIQLESNNRNFVWVAEGGVALKKYIVLGAFVGDQVEVLRGLNDGAQVVVEGQQKISEHMEVSILNH